MNSFIVPAHNEESGIGRTLASIHDAARTVGQLYEIVVVDDASTDTTAEIARQHAASVVQVNHRQIAATRNSGARAARGERLFFVDADTIVDRRTVAAAVRAMDRGAAGGGAPVRLDGAVPLYARLLLWWFSFFMRIAGLSGGAFMFMSRNVFQAIGGFDERLFGGEDAAMSLAIKREGRFALLWMPVLTSGRRTRTTPGLEMLAFFVGLAIFPRRVLRRQSAVEKMWYDSNRERDEVRPDSWSVRASNFAALVIMAALVTGPLWMAPWPESLAASPLGTVRYAVQILGCHVGLVLWPCAYFLLKSLVRQKRWWERIKLTLLIAVSIWLAWGSTREVYWFWGGLVTSW